MVKILVNDGMHSDGKVQLENAKYQVDTDKVAQTELGKVLPNYDVIIVRSATKVRKELIDQCPNLKVIARGGVGLDNIDVNYAKIKGIKVINTPAASSPSVAELAFAHIFTMARSLHTSNLQLPNADAVAFKGLKKSCSANAFQLRGKTIGIIGFGRIGQESAKIAIAMGMKVLAVDLIIDKATIPIDINGHHFDTTVQTVSWEEMLANSDIITLHVPGGSKPLIGKEEIANMKDGVFIVNTARGGTIDEEALVEGLDSGKVAGAGLDVFVGEPSPSKVILSHPKISVSPHIGGSTQEAQRFIGLELAEQIIGHFNE